MRMRVVFSRAKVINYFKWVPNWGLHELMCAHTNCVRKSKQIDLIFIFRPKSSIGFANSNWCIGLLAGFLREYHLLFNHQTKLIQVKVNSKLENSSNSFNFKTLVHHHLNFISIPTTRHRLNLINLNRIRRPDFKIKSEFSFNQSSISSNQLWLQQMIYQSSSYRSSLSILELLI